MFEVVVFFGVLILPFFGCALIYQGYERTIGWDQDSFPENYSAGCLNGAGARTSRALKSSSLLTGPTHTRPTFFVSVSPKRTRCPRAGAALNRADQAVRVPRGRALNG